MDCYECVVDRTAHTETLSRNIRSSCHTLPIDLDIIHIGWRNIRGKPRAEDHKETILDLERRPSAKGLRSVCNVEGSCPR